MLFVCSLLVLRQRNAPSELPVLSAESRGGRRMRFPRPGLRRDPAPVRMQ